MTGETPLAAMGVVVAWASALVLLLFFVGLRRASTDRRGIQLWVAAWAIQLISLTGSFLRSIGVLLGRPLDESGHRVLDTLLLPGTLLFVVLATLGSWRAVGRQPGTATLRRAAILAIVVGFAVELANLPTLTGTVLVTTTAGCFLGAAIAIARAERALPQNRFPELAVALILYGGVTGMYQMGASFGSLLWPIDDYAGLVGWSAGYGTALVSVVLGGAAALRLIGEVSRQATAPSVESMRLDPPVTPFSAPPQPVAAASPPWVAIPFERPEPAQAASSAPQVGDAKSMHPRTATLPLPPVDPSGRLAEAFVVDDEAAVRSLLARVFQRGGWPVRDASTGEEALAWLLDVSLEDAPTIILCDFKMSGMGGREVYEHLARDRPELISRIIFVTGDTSSESARAFIAETRCQVVEKPFTVTEIARAVEEVLAARQLRND